MSSRVEFGFYSQNVVVDEQQQEGEEESERCFGNDQEVVLPFVVT